MKIQMENNLVEFVPENEQEVRELSALWDTIIDCAKFNKKLAPIGEYIPGQTKQARFHIEGDKAGSEPIADSDGTYICFTCNQQVELKAGSKIPKCCGEYMERD